ncbi:hypothetical protein G6F51_014513 [Rhizopus arrhizus]|uniref:Uncharacterized protein n=1 Tax=Rhizopus oryzae TaxID=64495 RepID=A0A9P7BYW8_RHIOR|nr:hypothetical protein G6F51_014513 [Rhizopus arrhizus]
MIPNNVQRCLDHADHLSFKNFIETFDCLDRHRAQQRFINILSKYFNTNSERDRTINANYKTWINPADYLRFWGKKKDATTKVGAQLQKSHSSTTC